MLLWINLRLYASIYGVSVTSPAILGIFYLPLISVER